MHRETLIFELGVKNSKSKRKIPVLQVVREIYVNIDCSANGKLTDRFVGSTGLAIPE